MTAVDDLWGDMPGDLLVVTRSDLEQLATQAAATALQNTARSLAASLGEEYLGADGKGAGWTETRVRIWSEGVATALACVRRAGGALAHGRARL